MLYGFILGNNAELSKLEILSVFTQKNIEFTVHSYSKNVLILDIPSDFDVHVIMARLGGTIKIVKIYRKFAKFSQKQLVPLLISYLRSQGDVNGKLKYGFSLYLAHNNLTDSDIFQFKKRIFKLGMTMKTELKNLAISARLVVSKEHQLSSVIVKKNKLIGKGKDFVVLLDDDRSYFIGETVAIQDFELYSKIDYGRPGRDDKSGMLPPKLAQMMINLGQINTDKTLLDPFCGSGTVINQALLTGYAHIIASDLSDRAINDSQQNLAWFKDIIKDDRFKIANKEQITEANIQIFQKDVKKLSEDVAENSIGLIVAEPYMGEGVTKAKAQSKDFLQDRVQTMKDLEQLFIAAFREFHKVLQKDGTVVMIFPAFKVNKNTTIFADVLDKVRGLGFEISTQFADTVRYSERGSLLYKREHQQVMREIFVWKKI